jgi:cytochrome c oxidase assembly protein subunit 11
MSEAKAQNRMLLKKLIFVTLVMFAFGYAMVPFYKKICDVTGLSKDRVAVSNTQMDPSRWVTIEFDANVGPKLPWKFEPQVTSMRVHPGEVKQVMYRVVNLTDRSIVGQAVPSYGPALAVQYFKKIECFCFTQQTLKAREERLMPVQFVVQNDLPKDVNTITLSYTFFEQAKANAS